MEIARDKKEAEGLVRSMIAMIGDDPNRPGLEETPSRVVRSWDELYSGYEADVSKHIKIFDSKFDQMVMLRDISYFSMCEHHMLPFFGKVHIAYVPNSHGSAMGGGVLGLSKLCRVMNVFTRRLQIQEQMTEQIARAIQEGVNARGVAVVATGSHLCMMARGVSQQSATMLTSCMLGLFREDSKARTEVLHLMEVGR